MASYFGINGDFSSMFNFSNTAGSASGGSSVLGDYALIRNGSYKRLLNAYYAKDKTEKAEDAETEETKEDTKNKKALLKTKDSAQELSKAAEALKTADFTDTEAAAKTVQSFVDAYNNTITDAGEVDNKSVLQKTLWMIGSTKTSSSLLSQIGLKTGKDNKLTFDSEAFKKADMTAARTLFQDTNSYVGKVSQKAREIANLSTAAMKAESKGSAYNNRGDYTSIDTNKLYDNFF